MSGSDVVFTALFGNYEDLNELSHVRSPNTKYICFTDNQHLKSASWEIQVVKPAFIGSPARSSRVIKMLGHRYFEKDSRSLYVDNTVRLKVDGSDILNDWLAGESLAFMHHSTRKTVRGEFFACSAYGLDEQVKIIEQFRHYRKEFPSVLSEQPYWGGMIARINSESVDRFMEAWNREFNHFTKRDQLSINVSSRISGVKIHAVNGQNDHSLWHDWPVISARKTGMRDTTSNTSHRKLRIIKNGIQFGMRMYLPFPK